MGTLALIGDVGGHAALLRQALLGLGADPDTLDLPAGLTVVQVGDLVHRGPDSPGVLTLVRDRLDRQPGQWVQLRGNHCQNEIARRPLMRWPEVMSDGAVALMRGWVTVGHMRIACALDTAVGPLLVTHAGLTPGVWDLIGRPATAEQAADALNALPETDPGLVFRTGMMLGSEATKHLPPTPNLAAGPLWAEAGWELYQGWKAVADNGISVPFGQVHGHSSAFLFGRGDWRGPLALRPLFKVDDRLRHVKGVIGGKPFAGIDPCFGKTFKGTWGPLVLPGTVTAR